MKKIAVALLLISPVLLFATVSRWIPEGAARVSAKGEPSQKSLRDAEFEGLAGKAEENGPVRVIVGLQTSFRPEGSLTNEETVAQRKDIAEAQTRFLSRYGSLRQDTVVRFEFIPYLAFEAEAATIARLRDDPLVLSIEEDIIGEGGLAESTQIVGATAVWSSNQNGSGRRVAILDSGVDKSHSFLAGKVVSEACYSRVVAGTSTSVCPGGVEESTAAGSGVHCSSSISGCDHGTHVAGIAAGKGQTFSGVAKESEIIAIQIFSQHSCNGSPCARYWTSDLIKGLERVRTLANTMNNIDSVNLSLQTGQEFTTNCDGPHASTKAAIDNLRSVGIATVAISGNFSFTNALTAPGCISTSVSVGSTDDGSGGTVLDQVSSFSDSSQLLHLLAPGRWINSSLPGNNFGNFSGTSMAAPHVAGAYAVLRQVKPTATVDEIRDALIATGQPILDSRNGITKPRINLPAAVNLLAGGRAVFDFDGDGRTDPSVFRPSPTGALESPGPEGSSSQWWIYKSSDGGNLAYGFGAPTDHQVAADFTGDGKTDVAFWRPLTGEWFILRSDDLTYFAFPFGTNGDIPAPGDFDGDGKADPAVFRPSLGTWFIFRSSDSQVVSVPFGSADDKPTVADFDGDGADDIAVFRPSVSQWWQLRSTEGVKAFGFGAAGDRTAVADWTGDGKVDVAFYRPSTSEFFVIRSEDDSFYAFPWGAAGDIPTPGDYDGDGTADAAVWRPGNATWYVLGSTSGFQAIPFGAAGDIPVPSSVSVSGSSSSGEFPGSGFGSIPDSPGNGPRNYGPPRDIVFNVSGVPGAVGQVEVSFNASHTYVGDLKVTLIAPNGFGHRLFETTGATSGTSGGIGNDLSSSNTYTFKDTSANNWWTLASSGNPIPSGDARTVVSGGTGVPNPPPVTSLNSVFGGLIANGVWKLRFEDGWTGDTGTVTAATLRIVPQ